MLTINHKFVSAKSNGADNTLVQPSNWNDTHTIYGETVRLATAAALPTNTMSGGVLTANSNGALSVDGVTPSVNDRVLVKNEASSQNNGIYTVTTVGGVSSTWSLTRTNDMNTWASVPGTMVTVQEGTTNTGTVWLTTAALGSGVLNTTPIPWQQVNVSPVVPYPQGYMFGLTLSNDGVSPNTVLDIAAGQCRDFSNVDNMVLGSAYTKSTGSWAVGSGNGALDTGAVTTFSTYHVFLIKRTDSGVVDILFSLSPTAPTMPSGYTEKRRIGAILTDSSAHIYPFVQYNDEFLLSNPGQNVNVTNPGTAAVLHGLSVPTGIQVWAKIRGYVKQANNNNNYLLITSPDESDRVPNATTGDADVGALNNSGGGPPQISFKQDVRTNTSGQIRTRLSYSDISTSLAITTYGWIDPRGRLA